MKHSEPLQRSTRPRARGTTWTDEQFREARDRDLRERTAPIPSVLKAVVICLVLAAFLTSAKLVEIAERQEFGDTRDRQLAAAEGLDRVANFLSLNRPYDAVQALRGTGDEVRERVDTIEALAPTSPTSQPVAPAATTPVEATATETTTSTSTVVPAPIRSVTSDRPLQVLVAGDSQAEYLGQAVTSEHPGWALDVTIDDRISTSLARPDYFNWPAHLAALMADRPPDVVVLFIGANDHQDMEDAAGRRLVEDTAEWKAEWVERLELTLDLLAGADRQVLWVTQPPMRDGELDEGVRLINALAAPVLAERDFVTPIDIWDLFGGDEGYQDRLSRNGDSIDARVGDGVHLTRSAASWVAEMIFDELANVWTFVD